MPFVAKNRETGERIDITTVENPHTEIDPRLLVCPCEDCGGEMFVRRRRGAMTHFVHKAACKSSMVANGGAGESAAHLAGKRFIRDLLIKGYASAGVSVEIEYQMPSIGRIADIAVLFPLGHIMIHEIQLSPCTPADLRARTDDYARAGADVVWWLGLKAATEQNEQWCEQTFGDVQFIDFRWETNERQIGGRGK